MADYVYNFGAGLDYITTDVAELQIDGTGIDVLYYEGPIPRDSISELKLELISGINPFVLWNR